MKLIKASVNVLDDITYLSITKKVVDEDSGNLTNYSYFTLRFRNLSRAMHYLEQMAGILVDTDYHMEINIVKVS